MNEQKAEREAQQAAASEEQTKSGGQSEAQYQSQEAEAGGLGEEAAKEAELSAKLKETEEKLAEMNDQLLRKAAEFENSRKRIVREKEESIRYANAALLGDILPIIDDFERAIQSAADSKDFDSFHSGVSIIEKQLVSLLERNWGLRRFSAEGQVFDPEKHEAIAVQESGKHAAAVVLEDFQKGYLLHDRVLRPAKVKVAKPVTANEEVRDDLANDSSGNKE